MCGLLAYYSNINNYSIHSFIDKLKKIYNRGQDSVGISFIFNNSIVTINEKTFDELYKKTIGLKSLNILGHTKYTTSGNKNNNINQPINSHNKFGTYSLIFNGNIPLDKYNLQDKYNTDTEMIINYLNTSSYIKKNNNWVNVLEDFIENFSKAFCIIIQTIDRLYIIRDNHGVRPLTYTFHNNSNTFLFTSESSIFDKNDIIYEIYAGTIHGLNKYGKKELHNYPSAFETHCLFEYIYFLNKDSTFENTNITNYRENIGKLMAKRDKIYFESFDKDFIVCGVPNTGNDYAVSYANEIGYNYKNYIIKNNEISRTFILSNNEERNKYANIKYLFDKNIKNKNIILIDDSIVRGITLKNLIKNLKDFGVLQIHVIIASPPIVNTCNYGIDIPTKKELIFNNIDSFNLHDFFGCDTLNYLDLKLLNDALPDNYNKCTKCLTSDSLLDW